MLKKLGRGLITVIGGAFGYLAWLLIALGLNKSGNNVDKIFTSGQQTGVAIIFVIFFAIIFFRLAPSLGRQSFKVAINIESDLQDVSVNKILAGFIGLVMGFVIAFL